MASNIDASKPVDGAPASKADLRTNLAAAKSEIEALQTLNANMSPYAFNGMRNRLINGKMDVFLRIAGGARVTSAGSNIFTLDRWYGAQALAGGIIIMNQTTTSPPAQFYNYHTATVSVTKTLVAGDYHFLGQRMESIHTQDLLWGTANAIPVVVSFWVRASIAGTYAMAVLAAAGPLSYVTSYTINAPNTWEYKTVNIAAPTTGTWNTGLGPLLAFDWGCGTTYKTASPNQWNATTSYSLTSSVVNFVQSNAATWDITGIQFEMGTIATPFEHRLAALELLLCQRYYVTGRIGFSAYGTAAAAVNNWTPFRSILRGTPTVARSGESIINISSPTVTPSTEGLVISGSVTATGDYRWTATFTAEAEVT